MQLIETSLLTVIGSFLLGLMLGCVILSKVVRRRETARLVALQDRFVSLGSHYLLTPVSTIQAAIGRLQEAESMGLEDRRRMYEAILQGESRLWIIAQQLILMNQLGTDRFQLDFNTLDLSELVLDAIATLEPLSRQARVKVGFEDTTLGNSQVRADRRRLKQAVIAVIDNAIKFSPEGASVKVALGTAPKLCQLVVADAGAGMPAEVLAHVTQKFYRGSDLYRFDYEGMGIGMYIANRIVSLHQGMIHVQSAPKRGTRVTIEFPKL